ncbi:MAG: UDP-N-acetylglucosamine 2-epimerase (non-hydrolyzing) [Candidatus Omnitrophota bacterium]
MKIISVVGARPQFIKAAMIAQAIRAFNQDADSRQRFYHLLVHTGQHYDSRMSKIFFDQLDIPRQAYNLKIGSCGHAVQTGKMLIRLEKVLLKERPRLLLTYGDTNSALAGALTAVKLSIPIAHVEAGLRSFNRSMPEEVNRILIDHISHLCFCPTQSAVKNLKIEGIVEGVYHTGDVMIDALKYYAKIAIKKSTILDKLNINARKYYLATIHRPANTDNKGNLRDIINAFCSLDLPVIFPVHPRTKRKLFNIGFPLNKSNIVIIEPVSYFDMLTLEKYAKTVFTDSGGVQKEAYFFEVPCITLRTETEWIETVTEGWNVIAGADKTKIIRSALTFSSPFRGKNIFGRGRAAEKITRIISRFLSQHRDSICCES